MKGCLKQIASAAEHIGMDGCEAGHGFLAKLFSVQKLFTHTERAPSSLSIKIYVYPLG